MAVTMSRVRSAHRPPNMVNGYVDTPVVGCGQRHLVGVERLQRAACWDRPADLVTAHTRTIMAGTPDDIELIANEHGLGQSL